MLKQHVPINTNQYEPDSTLNNINRTKREGSDDEFEMTALYVYIAGQHTKEYKPGKKGRARR